MSLWQFRAATGGHAKANRAEGGLNTEEAAHLADWLDAPAVWH